MPMKYENVNGYLKEMLLGVVLIPPRPKCRSFVFISYLCMKRFLVLCLSLSMSMGAALPQTTSALSVPYTPDLIDDSDLFYFKAVGEWTQFPLDGYNGNFTFAAPAQTGNHTTGNATWLFPSLQNGKYNVWTTWSRYPHLATNAPFTLHNNNRTLETTVNQQKNPRKKFDDGRWEKLGTFDINGTLEVRLTNDADGYVVADAVRIEYVGPADPLPECWDGVDNDEDGLIDFPEDPDCESRKDDGETDAIVSIVKEGPDVIHPNTNVTYVMTIKNNDKRTLKDLRIVDATFVTNGMTIVPELSDAECVLGTDGSAVKCGPYKLKKGESKTVTLTGLAPNYACERPDISNTAAVQLRTLQTTDSSVHTADVQCVPVCGNNICEQNEGAHGCDPYFDPITGQAAGCEDYFYCPQDCLGNPGPTCPGEPLLHPVPDGCAYSWSTNEDGCEIPTLICVAEPVCPLYDLAAPPPGCHYEYHENEDGCEVPELICEATCGDSICEDSEQCQSICNENGACLDSCGPSYCAQDCGVIELPYACPELLLAEPGEGCAYQWLTVDEHDCPQPTLVCEVTHTPDPYSVELSPLSSSEANR